jgi:hypothetical protein
MPDFPTTPDEWKTRAIANGWIEMKSNPVMEDDVPRLYHAETDRIWPLDDWEGALRDLGFDENEVMEDWL